MFLVPMLPEEQNRKLFGKSDPTKIGPRRHEALQVKAEIERYGLPPTDTPWMATITKLPDTSKRGPLGELNHQAERLWGKTFKDFDTLACFPVPGPPKFPRQQGWTRVSHAGKVERVPFPLEDTIVFDTETVVRMGNHPIIGTAVSDKAWYLWLHPAIANQEASAWDERLIDLKDGQVFIAHNALFDMAKVKGAYDYDRPQLKPAAFCTMAAHTAMSGMGGDQVSRAFRAIPKGAPVEWVKHCCPDSLAAVVKHYVGLTVEKEARDLFVTGSLQAILGEADKLIDYALKDTYYTALLWVSLWPKFKVHCPSPFTWGGLLELSQTFLPIHPSWDRRVMANDQFRLQKEQELTKDLQALAENLVKQFLAGELETATDPWLSQLDWTPAKTGKFKGWPAWFRKAKRTITLGSNLVPLLLKMAYQGQPLYYHPKSKWGYKDESGQYHKLPHPDGTNANLGSPLCKGYAKLIEKDVITSDSEINLAKAISQMSYWVSYTGRFNEQYMPDPGGDRWPQIIPTTKLIGTLTGRQVEKTWLTAAQAKPGKLGSDLFHSIQAPPGWVFDGWDEDTEEMKLGALFGDVQRSQGIGCTAMSQSALLGTKANGTDSHTITAKACDVARSPDAKGINFKVMYAGGRKSLQAGLRSQHPEWTDDHMQAVLDRAISAKKGDKIRGKYSGGTDSDYHNMGDLLANTPDFRLPMSQRQIPHAVNAKYDPRGGFYTSRFNFPVQGSGVDILHATALLAHVLADQQGIPRSAWQYVLARHDEIWFLVREEYKAQFAEIGNTAHCWAWAAFIESLGYRWMPECLTRLNEINVDKVVRKEVFMSTDAGWGAGYDFGPELVLPRHSTKLHRCVGDVADLGLDAYQELG